MLRETTRGVDDEDSRERVRKGWRGESATAARATSKKTNVVERRFSFCYSNSSRVNSARSDRGLSIARLGSIESGEIFARIFIGTEGKRRRRDLGRSRDRERKVSMSSRASTSLCPLSSVIIYKYKCVYMYMYVSIAVSNGNREEDNRASARNPPSRGFHAPDGTRSSSTNRRSTLVPSVAFVNPAFSPMERVKGK